MGNALARHGKVSEAVIEFHTTLRLRPDLPPALATLAWILATSGNASVRNAAEAVSLAERLRAVTGADNAEVLDVLAAAYAEAGRFNDAIEAAHKAADLAQASGQKALTAQIRERLKWYQAGRPYREGPILSP